MFKWLYKVLTSVNSDNSSAMVQCVATERCMMRHTTLCEKCENNIGAIQDKNLYKPKYK